jgi:adenylate kinase
MRVVMLGAPGAGKGTQAKKISEKFNIPHVSTGDILRREIKNETELGLKAESFVESGKLVSDELVIEIIKNFIQGDSAENGFLMDGFPRNLAQAKKFAEMLGKIGLKLDLVINIVVDSSEIINRLGMRRTCRECQKITSMADSNDGIGCPECGGELFIRKDDEEKVISHRLEVYEKETRPLVEYYSKGGILANIDGLGTEEEVTERILRSL